VTGTVRNFEPTSVWSNSDGTPTARALGWMRSISDFIGATFGAIPPSNLDGAGTSTATFLRNDGTYAIPDYPVGANPSASVGIAVVNGSAVTFMRSDGAPAIDLAIAPTWTAAHVFSAGITGTTISFSSSITGDSLVAVNGFGCNGKTAQTEVTIGAAVSTTAATNVGPYGYTTQAQADDIVNRINAIRSALIANGILV
jgi:hypothetical protein